MHVVALDGLFSLLAGACAGLGWTTMDFVVRRRAAPSRRTD